MDFGYDPIDALEFGCRRKVDRPFLSCAPSNLDASTVHIATDSEMWSSNMSPDPCEAFNEWCELEGLENKTQIAKTIGVGVSSIPYWRSGEREPPKNVLLACAAISHNQPPMEAISDPKTVRNWATDRRLSIAEAADAWGISPSLYGRYARGGKGAPPTLTYKLAAAAATMGIPPINHQSGEKTQTVWPKVPMSERPDDERYSNPGHARARTMTPEQRSESARKAAAARWAKAKKDDSKPKPKKKVVVR